MPYVRQRQRVDKSGTYSGDLIVLKHGVAMARAPSFMTPPDVAKDC